MAISLATLSRNQAKPPRIIIHGEPGPSAFFAEEVKKNLGWDARPAEYRETIEV